MNPSPIDRLLRSAASVPAAPGAEMPFGFDTRVLALWRASLAANPAAIMQMLRRVVFMALALIILASAGAYREWRLDDPSDDYALTDSAIGGVLDQ
ncbi:MAG: hypothetical protein ACR2MW_02970 [Chthoniobacterales bacterium]